MWLILVDRSASMGDQFAGIVDGAGGASPGQPSRVRAVVEQLAARGEGLTGSKVLFFTTPEVNWPVVDVEGSFDAAMPDPLGITDLAAALTWAHETVVPLDPATDVHVLLLTDLRTTQDNAELQAAADALLHKATVHLILLDPSYLTLALASSIAPGRVLLAASVSGLAKTLAGLFPGPPRPFELTAAEPASSTPQPAPSHPALPATPFVPAMLESYESSRDSLVGRAMDAIGRRVRTRRGDRPEPVAVAEGPAVSP